MLVKPILQDNSCYNEARFFCIWILTVIHLFKFEQGKAISEAILRQIYKKKLSRLVIFYSIQLLSPYDVTVRLYECVQQYYRIYKIKIKLIEYKYMYFD